MTAAAVHLDPTVLRDLLDVPFTDEQLAAATAPLEPAVVIAGAGSGKTTVMAARVVWLVVSGQVRPEEVLGLTFTNKAAAELAQRIRAALRKAAPSIPGFDDDVDAEPTVATYHAYAGRLLREHGLWIGVEPSARLLADATRFQLADRALRRARGPFPELDRTVSNLVGDVVQLDGELNEHLATVEQLIAEDERIKAEIVASAPGHHHGKQSADSIKAAKIATQRSYLASIVAEMRRDKDRLSVIDFGDQVALAAKLCSEHAAVAAVERERFRVVLLDEYQDTSVAQKRLLAALFGGGHPVTAVGDPCQAIYGWRGAWVGNIDAFPDDFPRGDGQPATRYALAQNNRSGGRLLDLANGLATRLRARHPGVVALLPRPEVVTDGDTVCGLFETYAQEVNWVCDVIAADIKAGRPPDQIAVLVRVRSDFPAYHDALVAKGVPVEVVGLGGLLSLPEVAELVAMLGVLDDSTANPDLVRLLAGPRWRIGPRDLVILGERATDLVRHPSSAAGDDQDDSVERLLEKAVEGVDPAEITSLSEALEHPGDGPRYPYSTEALTRFGLLAAEIRDLRRHLGEPLLDLIHRVVAVSGLEVEVGAAPGGPASRRSAALSAFLDNAAAFADLEGDPSVRAFLAYLRAAEEFERGLDTTAPSPGESVKLLTVHKAKGLEWPVVVLPNLTAGVFPSRSTRSTWATSAAMLPRALRGDAADLPDIGDYSTKAFKAYVEELRTLDALEELRLAYVAVTRAKDKLVASSHWWGPSQSKPRGPSDYLLAIRDHCETGAGQVVAWYSEPGDVANPYLRSYEQRGWPLPLQPGALAERRRAAGWVREVLADDGSGQLELDIPTGRSPLDGLSASDRELVEDWDRDLAALLEEARRSHQVSFDVPLPSSLSASALVRLAVDPGGLARDLARPMPRPPAPAATRGTRFHAWVEAQFGEQPLLDRLDLEGAADDDLVGDEELGELQQAFLAGPYAGVPPHRVEAPFQLVLGGRVVRGRIDAVYRTEAGYDVIDWKTGRGSADPLQLAVYRAAWARIAGVPEDAVGAAFYYVATGRIDRHDDLPGAAALEGLLTGAVAEAVEDGTAPR